MSIISSVTTRSVAARIAVLAAVAVLLAIPLLGSSGVLPQAVARHDDGHARGFDRFLEQYEAANTAFVNGDPTLWMSLITERDPASIFGGLGGLGESGIEEVGKRYGLAATAFQPSGAEVAFEYLVKDVRGRLAYTVAIERAQVMYSGHTELSEQVLRVTMIFRRDEGRWTIVHRHADTMVALELPTPR